MRTFVNAFKTLNNKSSGSHGVKKLSNINKTKNLTTLMEGYGDLTVLSCTNSSSIVIRKSETKMSLRKSNKTAWVSKKQETHFHKSKKKLCIYFSKKGLVRSTMKNNSARRVFIKLD